MDRHHHSSTLGCPTPAIPVRGPVPSQTPSQTPGQIPGRRPGLNRRLHSTGSAAARRAFSITELLVVIGIITLLVGLLLPALAAAQNKARATQTTGVMEQFALACESFFQKFGYYPGVVPEDVLAADPKISGTENAILHLMGGFIRQEDDPALYAATTGGDWQEIVFGTGPNPYRIRVSRTKIGEGPVIAGQLYPPFFSPKGSELKAAPGQFLDNTNASDPFEDDDLALPDLLDGWGQPIMYLRALRESGPLAGPVAGNPLPQFARGPLNPYLSSVALGESGKTQAASILNQGNNAAQDNNLAQLIRHPAFGAPDQPLAGTAKGQFIVFSAGKDGIFYSQFDGPGSPASPVAAIAVTGPKVVDEYDDLRRFGGG